MRTVLIALAALALAVVLVISVEPLRTAVDHVFHGDLDALRAQIRSLGAWGPVLLVTLILLHAVLPFPAELVNATAGLVYGFVAGLPLVLAAWIVSAVLAYWLGVAFGRPLALRLGGEANVAKVEHVVDRGGVPALLVVRLVPFMPYSLTGYIAGATRVPLWRYTWTSAVGILPITAAATYLGSELSDLSAGNPLLWVALAVLAALGALTVHATRRLRRTTPPG